MIRKEEPIDGYTPVFRHTEWRGTRVIDVLDMTSGMDIVANQANRENPRSIISRYNHATAGEPNAEGKIESQLEVIRSAGRRWADIFQDRVWARMGVEGDMQVALAPDGTPQVHGPLSTRLRDLARYGLLYTPSWAKASRARIVTDAYVRQIQSGGRKQLLLKGELGNRLVTAMFPAHPPSAIRQPLAMGRRVG